MYNAISHKQKRLFHNIDWILVILWLVLVITGWLNIFSTGNNHEFSNLLDFSQRYGKQLLWIILAMVIGLFFLILDPRLIPPLSNMIYIVFNLSLVAVLIFGTEVNASRSWFQVGGFALQPAEFAKVATAMAMARYMSNINFDIHNRKTLLTIAGIIALPTLLIMLQPDLGSAIVLLSLGLMLYRFGLWPWYLYGAIILAVLFLLDMLFSSFIVTGIIVLTTSIIILVMRSWKRDVWVIAAMGMIAILLVFAFDFMYTKGLKPHQKERIEVYLDNLQGIDRDIRNVGYNFYQSKVAIGSGGWIGKGYLQGTQTKMNFIPEQDTDFIFCTVGEEWGFLGSMFIITVYLFLLYRIIQRAEMQRSRYSKIYGYCVVSILLFHFVINVGMTIGLTPVIGIPLPFMSYGGSSLWAFTILLFIFIKQDMHRYEVVG
jgi:rod shape determining protein RodA